LLDQAVHLDVGNREPKELISATEQSLAVIWSEVFNIDDIGRADDFYDLGGHSVMAMQIASRVLDTFGVELPIEVFLSCRTLGAMAKSIDDLSCPTPALIE
jgi:acyl carrier protein